MAINNNDVKLFESQRLSDEEDGGGRVTGRKVINGNVNNLFQDISRIDCTVGDEKLGSGLSLYEYLCLSLKRQLLCLMKDQTLIFASAKHRAQAERGVIGARGAAKSWALYCALWQWQGGLGIAADGENLYALSEAANKSMTLPDITGSFPLSLIGQTVLPVRNSRLCRLPVQRTMTNTF